MKLKATYDKKEDIPEGYVDLFQEKGEKWAIQIEGITTEANVARLEHAIKQEREENQKLREEAKLHGKTPDEVQAIVDELEAAKIEIESGGKKLSDEQMEKLLDTRVRMKIGPLERQIQKLTKERDDSLGESKKLSSEIITGKIELAIRSAAEKAKVIPSAITDMVMRGRQQFELVEENGKVSVITKDGASLTPGLNPDGWVEELKQDAPHYWPANVGAGANGGGLSLGITEKNPFTKPNWNMTEQGQIYRKYGHDKTEQLAKSVGSHIGATAPPEK